MDVHRSARTTRQDRARSRLHGHPRPQAGAERAAEQRTAGTGRNRSAPPVRCPGLRAGNDVPVLRQRSQGSSVPVGFINYLPHSAQSNYHSFFTRVEKPFRNGLSWLASYTFSKAITNAPQFRNAGGVNGSENSPAQDAFNLRAERGLASFDTRQRLVNTVVYQLPFGRTQKYLRYGVASKLLGGWETLRHRHRAVRLPLHPEPARRHGGRGRRYGRHLRAAQPGSRNELAAAWRSEEHVALLQYRGLHGARPPARSAVSDATR